MRSQLFCHFDPSPPAAENRGRLAGRRVAVQSLIGVRNWPTEGGCRALEGYVPLEDATVVRRLRAAGARVVGNTPASELGWGIGGDGSARTLSAGQVDIVLMLDTLGEARMAAATTGLCGFKPSWGRISRFGLIGLVPSMECCGLLAREPKELAQVFQAVHGTDERDPSMIDAPQPGDAAGCELTPGRVTVGVAPALLETLSPSERNTFSRAMTCLQATGMTLREVDFRDEGLYAAVHQVIAAVEASSSCGKYDGVRFGHRAAGAKNWNEMYLQTRCESFGQLLKSLLFQGAYFQFENYPAFENACRIRARLVEESRRLFEGLDLLLLPTQHSGYAADRAQTLDQLYRAFALTLLANVTGQPAISLPGLYQSDERDLGLQLVGSFLRDETVLFCAQTVMAGIEAAA